MIVTFYSFKGGVGRSHLLVDVAARLAGEGLSVLVWDLDLEAPGIQNIPALRHLAPSGGTLDLLQYLQKTGEMPPLERWEDLILPLPLEGELAKRNGRLAFLFPRQLDDKYEEEFASIDWVKLFSRRKSAGPAFLHRGAALLMDELGYEVVLVDARTGLTPLGAVCVTSLPNLVVGVFNLNEQNLAGITRAHRSVTELHGVGPDGGERRFLLAANMVPDRPADIRQEKLDRLRKNGLAPLVTIPLTPELLLTDQIPALAGIETTGSLQVAKLAEEIRREYEARRASRAAERAEKKRLATSPEDFDELRRRGILDRAKAFEEQVAELFAFQGYRTTLDYSSANLQFDVLLEKGGALKDWVLVECKDRDTKVSQREVVQFAQDVTQAELSDERRYRPVIVSRSGFVNHANQAAARNFVNLLTFDELTDSLVDFKPALGQILGSYRGTALERLYVETDAILERKLAEKRPLTETVREWIEAPGGTLLTLLGDFGSGKSSFCLRLASELAEAVHEDRSAGRIPILVDLKHSGGATAQLENVLTDHFQRVSSQTILPQALLHLNREGRLVLILDGFDEVIGYAEPARFIEHLRQLLRAAEGRAKVILTCRTHYFRDRPEALNQIGGAAEHKGRHRSLP
jgi:restriction endonuclease/NACHT domain-containing protein